LVPASLAAILLSAGKSSKRALRRSYEPAVSPPCVRCGMPAAAHIGGWCPPSRRQR